MRQPTSLRFHALGRRASIHRYHRAISSDSSACSYLPIRFVALPLMRVMLGNVELETSMNSVQVEQKSYEMPPREGITVAHFLTVADIDRSMRFYEKVFGGRILSKGDSEGAPGYIQIANTWLIVNVGGGPTPDKPSVTLSVLADPNK